VKAARNLSLPLSSDSILAREGYRVIVAEDGQKGWVKFQDESPFLVLADIKMPGLDGIGLLQKIKEVSPDTAANRMAGPPGI